MSGKFTIEVLDADVKTGLARLQEKTGDTSQALHIIGRVLRDRVKRGFNTSTSPYGVKWAPLKIREGQPLRDTSRLLGSINYRVGGDYVDVGTNVAYAPVHQFGATIKPKTKKWLRFMGKNGFIFAKQVVVPARPFMPIQADQVVLPDAWALAAMKQLKQYLDPKGGA